MSGETYTPRYPGGFVDLPAQTTAIDSQFLNAVEAALVRLLGEDPVDGEIGVWSSASGRLIYQLLTNAQVAGGAGISRAKLDFGAGLVDADIAPGAAISSSKISGLTGGAIPSGVMVPYPGVTPPSGWLLCDGSAVSRATYAGIFAVLGVAAGVGDGTTTFNLPDYRGRTFVGLGTHADVATMMASDGLAVGLRRPKHKHAHTFAIGTDTPDHGHQELGGDQLTPFTWPSIRTGGSSSQSAAGATGTYSYTGGANVRHTHPLTGAIGPQTGSEPTDTVAYLTSNVIIKT